MNLVHFCMSDPIKQDVFIAKVAESPFSKEISITMIEGGVLHEHAAPRAITIMVVSGNIKISSGNECEILHVGDMVIFDANIPHSLEAIEKSIVRLSIQK